MFLPEVDIISIFIKFISLNYSGWVMVFHFGFNVLAFP